MNLNGGLTSKRAVKSNTKKIKRILKNIDKHVDDENKLRPTTFIVGYGSIINTESRVSTGGKDIGNAIPVRICKSAGLRRVWNFQKPDVARLTALGLEMTRGSKLKNRKGKIVTKRSSSKDVFCQGKGSTINGVLYPVYSNIRKFDEREEGYFRLRLRKNQLEALSWQNLPSYDCKIYVYCIDKPHQKRRPTFDLPILQTYVDVCIKGCLEYGENFAREFIQTTGGWSKFWLNDRQIPRRPWLHEPMFKIVDQCLKRHCKKYGSILPEDYDEI